MDVVSLMVVLFLMGALFACESSNNAHEEDLAWSYADDLEYATHREAAIRDLTIQVIEEEEEREEKLLDLAGEIE